MSDNIFEATAKLELMQTLTADLINKVEHTKADTPERAMYFATQQDTIADFLHILLDGIFDSIQILEATEATQDESDELNCYKRLIIKTLDKIESSETLQKILTVAQTHLQIQNGEV